MKNKPSPIYLKYILETENYIFIFYTDLKFEDLKKSALHPKLVKHLS